MTLNDIDVSGYDTLLLDRDGTINVWRPNDYVKCWDEFVFISGVKEALARFAQQCRYIFVVTNQRGVGKSKMTEAALHMIHDRMTEEVAAAGGRIDGVYYCTALLDSDPMRKPNRGMFDQILADYPDIDPARCLMVGDMESDMLFAQNCGIDGVMVE